MEDKILEILKNIKGEILIYNGNDMLGDGVIDSFDVIDIICALEEGFNIQIDIDYVSAENFANKETINQLIKNVVRGKSDDFRDNK